MESPEGGTIRGSVECQLRTCSVEPGPSWRWKVLLGRRALTVLSEGNEGYAQKTDEKKNLFPIFTE